MSFNSCGPNETSNNHLPLISDATLYTHTQYYTTKENVKGVYTEEENV